MNEKQKLQVAETGGEILSALETVATAARTALGQPARPEPSAVLATCSNLMTGALPPSHSLTKILHQQHAAAERTAQEPFVTRSLVMWEEGKRELLFITRGSCAGLRANLKLATYNAPLGRVASFGRGESGTVLVRAGTRNFEVIERVQLRPHKHEDAWDALDSKFEIDSLDCSLASIREFLRAQRGDHGDTTSNDFLANLRAEDTEANNGGKTRTWWVGGKFRLRDQAILDRYQDEIFRLPLDKQVFLLGPPGSGKTTTLIQRISQKRNPDGRTHDESLLLRDRDLEAMFALPSAWAMFSPTELLQLYLADAFTREQVPAERGRNLRIWRNERLDLARNVLGILRSPTMTRGFVLDPNLHALVDESSFALSKLHDDLAARMSESVCLEASAALKRLTTDGDATMEPELRALRRGFGNPNTIAESELHRLMEVNQVLRPAIAHLKSQTDREITQLVNVLLDPKKNPGLIDVVVHALPGLQSGADVDGDGEDEVEDDERPIGHQPKRLAAEYLVAGLKALARARASGLKKLTGRLAKVPELLGSRLPPDKELRTIGKKLLRMRDLRRISNAPRALVMGIPQFYMRYRGSMAPTQFTAAGIAALEQHKLSACEVDVLILAMLTAARRFFDADSRRLRNTLPDWLDTIRGRYIPQVFVDEATDFSAVELACMLELSHPSLRSFFACGDFRQRLTTHGIADVKEFEWISRVGGLPDPIECRRIEIPYRQTPRLQRLCAALTNEPDPADDASCETNFPPLLAERLNGDAVSRWLAERIREIERAIKRSPSVAVFVDNELRVDPLVTQLQAALAKDNIQVAACHNGKAIGDNHQVRVFDVRHVKGLEFEAVFFVGIDSLEAQLPELFEQYLLVGMTRAATFLGLSCENTLPSSLARVRQHLSSGTWQAR